MADIASSDLTYTLVKSRKEDSSNKVINLTVAFGNATLTYPSGGIPLLKASLGCPNNIVSLLIDGPASADGIIYKYDKTNNKIRMYQAASHTHDFKVIGSQAAASTDAISAKTLTLGKEAATNITIAGANSATLGGVVSLAQGPLTEVASGSYAPAATTLYVEVTGW